MEDQKTKPEAESLQSKVTYPPEVFLKACNDYDEDAINKVLDAIAINSGRLRRPEGYLLTSDIDYLKSNLRWNSEEVALFMRVRAKLISRKVMIDYYNENVFNLLCLYWSGDPQFVETAGALGTPNPSLHKGILLAGNVGVGKTFLMRLFAHNQRFSYYVVNAKDLANTYQKGGICEIEKYYKSVHDGRQLGVIKGRFKMDFRFDMLGLCIDDIGAEEKKNYMGNPMNVVEDIIENRYDKKQVGVTLHGTTNLTAKQLQEYYGARVFSRLKQIVNFIELPGNDRRSDSLEGYDPFYKDKPTGSEWLSD
jgi:hypothetical protein